MYRLLSAHVLALIDDSVISIERYIVVQRCRLPPCLTSSDPVSQCGDLYCGHSAAHVPDQMLVAGNQSDRCGQGHSFFTVTMTKKCNFYFWES